MKILKKLYKLQPILSVKIYNICTKKMIHPYEFQAILAMILLKNNHIDSTINMFECYYEDVAASASRIIDIIKKINELENEFPLEHIANMADLEVLNYFYSNTDGVFKAFLDYKSNYIDSQMHIYMGKFYQVCRRGIFDENYVKSFIKKTIYESHACGSLEDFYQTFTDDDWRNLFYNDMYEDVGATAFYPEE